MSEFILEMRKIRKSFPGVQALDDVSFDLRAGEVHAILGENGAGKSTLIKILTGIYSIDSGSIFIKSREAEINNVKDARTYQIAAIHQELILVPYITVARNIFLGREVKDRFGLMNDQFMNKETQDLFDSLGVQIKADDVVASYSIAQQQLIEIVKALSLNAEILVMDEPTSALTENEVKLLFNTIKKLKSQGTSIIYISHRMDEIFEICDCVTVLRDGKYIGTRQVKNTTRKELVNMMIGRTLDQFYVKDSVPQEEVSFVIKNLNSDGVFADIYLDVRRGEILGVSGMVGSGRTELARALFGIDPITTGEIWLEGEKLALRHKPQDSLRTGIYLIPENRKEQGLFLINTVLFNLTISRLDQFFNFCFWNRRKEEAAAQKDIDNMNIRVTGLDQMLVNISGGNQQKIVISKCLALNPRLFIMDEPTRGVDVGAKAEIYDIMNQLTKAGAAIIMISSELPEIVNMSDRVAVMHKGRITAVLEGNDINQEKIISYAV
jgi:ribose transport system ATP-binding protein/inositol transport system ATP-binding protein